MSRFTDFLTSTGSSVATGLVNFGLNQYSASQQRAWQERMMDKQNFYNSPLSQSLRMRAAGLNPYQEMGAVPSASAGTGATAAPANISNPLELLNAFATHDNIVAQTGKVETERDKILKEISALDLAYQRGWLEKEDYERRCKAKWQLYEELGETEETAAIKNTLADSEEKKSATDVNKANADYISEQAKKTESDRLFTEALTKTENALREPRVASERAKAAAANASAEASLAQAAKDLAQGKTIEYENQRQLLRNNAMEFYGFDPTTLPNELAATLMNNYAAVVESGFSVDACKKAMDLAHELLQHYRNKSLWTPTTTTFSWNTGARLGDFEYNHGQSSTISN